MKLALIRRHFSATGGAELYLQRLLNALTPHGHELHLFAESWTERTPGLTLHQLHISGSRAQRPTRFALAVRDELAKQSFDCVFSLERTLQQEVYRAGDGVHRVWLQRRRQFASWWRKPFIGWSAFHRNMLRLEAQTFDPRYTRHIIVNSEMVRREILEHFRFPAERIHLVRNGVDVPRFQGSKRAETRARFGVRDDEFLLLFVGSGWERKGLQYLLRALDKVQIEQGVALVEDELGLTLPQPSSPGVFTNKTIKLLVVGKGRKPSRVPGNIIFTGLQPDVENAYAAADLFAFLPIYDPSANVVFEALAAGLPVVTSVQNGASEMIEEKVNGSVVDDPSDTQRVVQAIAYWWSRRFAAPPVRVADLSLDRNVAETLAILEMAAREKAR